MTQLRLTQNQTVFEYADSLDDNRIPYHRGLIPISEIALYQQFRFENIRTNIRIIQRLCDTLYTDIHGGQFDWLSDTDFPEVTNYTIMSVIIGRLKCVTNEYNEYDNFHDYVRRTGRIVRFDYMDDEEYQTRLSHYIINFFISWIGENETIKIFAKHYGDIVNYLFYHQNI